MSEESYFKEVRKLTFIIGWIPYLVERTLGFFCGYYALAYLIEKTFPGPILPFIAVSILNFWDMRRTYCLIKEKPFVSMSDDKLILNFEKHTFLWDYIQSVSLEGERKLTVVYDDKGNRKKKMNDLMWLSKKKDFINNLKNNCIKRKIPCKESELTLFSRSGLFLELW